MAERITSKRNAEAIGDALEYVPWRMREIAVFDGFCGDALFAGLHRIEVTPDGRSYRGTAHACFPTHVADKRMTLVFPEPPAWYTVIHELGHALDWALTERAGRALTFSPVTEYARTNRWEAFAEAFAAWFWPFGECPVVVGEPDRAS